MVKHATLTCVFVKRVKQEIARAQIRSVRSVSSALRTDHGCKLLSHTLKPSHTHTHTYCPAPRGINIKRRIDARDVKLLQSSSQTRRCFLFHCMNYNYFSPFLLIQLFFSPNFFGIGFSQLPREKLPSASWEFESLQWEPRGVFFSLPQNKT